MSDSLRERILNRVSNFRKDEGIAVQEIDVSDLNEDDMKRLAQLRAAYNHFKENRNGNAYPVNTSEDTFRTVRNRRTK